MRPAFVDVDNAEAAASRCLLLCTFIGLQLLDVISTNTALSFPGCNHELNPIVATLQMHFGAAWFAPKLVFATLGFAILLPRRRFAIAANVVYIVIVAANILAF